MYRGVGDPSETRQEPTTAAISWNTLDVLWGQPIKFIQVASNSDLRENQEIDFFEHLKYNFKTSWPPKISIFKKHFTAKITLILMIKKIPQTFLDVEK